MFVGRLTAEEQDAFLNLALRLIAVDGRETAAELDLFRLLRAEAAHLSADWTPSPAISRPDLLQRLRRAPAGHAVLVELFGLAHADLDHSPAEHRFILEIADQLGVSPVRCALLESWVLRQLALSEEGEHLLGDA